MITEADVVLLEVINDQKRYFIRKFSHEVGKAMAEAFIGPIDGKLFDTLVEQRFREYIWTN